MMLDWVGRTLLLVLAGLSTFAVVASLMAASAIRTDRPLPSGTVAERTAEAGVADERDARVQGAEPGDAVATGNVRGVQRAPVAVPQRPDPVEQWLEALTYAVLALAGLAAAALLVLLRITFHLSRIAQARS
jgi:hypothetical protein